MRNAGEGRNLPNIKFNPPLSTDSNGDKDLTLKEIETLEKKLSQADELRRIAEEREKITKEKLSALKAQITALKDKNKTLPDQHDYNEA